jgi:hypothetical protein
MTILGLLGLLFIGLKLAGVIAWSWWLVLLPFYAGIALFLGLLILGGGLVAVGSLFTRRR